MTLNKAFILWYLFLLLWFYFFFFFLRKFTLRGSVKNHRERLLPFEKIKLLFSRLLKSRKYVSGQTSFQGFCPETLEMVRDNVRQPVLFFLLVVVAQKKIYIPPIPLCLDFLLVIDWCVNNNK